MGPVTESHVGGRQLDPIGFPIRPYREVPQVSGVMPLRTVESMLLAIWIEVNARRFEVRSDARGVLMKMDGVFSGRKIMQVKFKPDPLSLDPQSNGTDRFAIAIFQFDNPLGASLRC